MVTFSPTNEHAMLDQQLHDRVSADLAQRHLPGLRRLIVEVHQGTVTVRGQVRSFYEKQVLQDACRRTAGLGRFIDLVDVASAPALAWART